MKINPFTDMRDYQDVRLRFKIENMINFSN